MYIYLMNLFISPGDTISTGMIATSTQVGVFLSMLIVTEAFPTKTKGNSIGMFSVFLGMQIIAVILLMFVRQELNRSNAAKKDLLQFEEQESNIINDISL